MRWSPQAHRFAPAVAFLAAAACATPYGQFPRVLHPLGLTSITSSDAILHVAVPLMLPVSLLSGIFFTLIGAALREAAGSDIEATGVLTLANTAGAALGSLVAGFVLLPVLGIEKSIFAISILYVLIGVVSWLGPPRDWRAVKARPTLFAFAAAGIALVALAVFPFGQLTNTLLPIPVTRWAEGEPERRVVAVHEGRTETVVFFQRMLLGKPVSDVMLTNSFSMSTTGYGVRRYQKLYVYWPMAVHPALKRALLIGYGVGNTAKAMTDSPSLESIDLVDLSRDILSMAPIVFPDAAASPLNDPRMHVHIEDGRYFLQATDRTFDLITGEPPPPGIAGVENLYSREYFALMRDRLAGGGIVTYWLPLADLSDVSAKAILRAFCDVFDDCSLWNGSGTNLMMIGTRNASTPASYDQFIRQWNDKAILPEMERLGIERPQQLGALFIGDASFVRGLIDDAAPLTDDRPKVIEAPFSSQEDATRLFAAVTDTGAARTRFQSSAFIARLWPKPLIDLSIPYFDVQHVIDAHMYGNQVRQNLALDDVHRVLTGSGASTPVEWRLASNSDIQQAIEGMTAQEQQNPVVQYQLGIQFLSQRRYRNAADAFNRATAAPEVRDNAFVLYIYSLCMSGQTRQAQAISHEAFAASGATSLPPIWIWMKETFGLDPTKG
jgi:spermidine synthase